MEGIKSYSDSIFFSFIEDVKQPLVFDGIFFYKNDRNAKSIDQIFLFIMGRNYHKHQLKSNTLWYGIPDNETPMYMSQAIEKILCFSPRKRKVMEQKK
jgi:hypothetical protein